MVEADIEGDKIIGFASKNCLEVLFESSMCLFFGFVEKRNNLHYNFSKIEINCCREQQKF